MYVVLLCLVCRGWLSSLRSVRFLVIDEADKLLDYHFSYWLPKLLEAVSRDKAAPGGCGLGSGGVWSLEGQLRKLCLHPERFRPSKQKLSQQVCHQRYSLTPQRISSPHLPPAKAPLFGHHDSEP